MAWIAPAPPLVAPVPPSARTAKILILVGLIFELIGTVLLVAIGVLTLAAFVGFFFLAAGIIGLLILFLVYLFTYARIRDADYAGARVPTLVWTIILFLTLNLIPAILFLIAYFKLGDAVREAERPPAPLAYGGATYGAAPFGPAGTMPTLAFPPSSGGPVPTPSGSSACPRCGLALTYIPEYAKWYCARERSYL